MIEKTSRANCAPYPVIAEATRYSLRRNQSRWASCELFHTSTTRPSTTRNTSIEAKPPLFCGAETIGWLWKRLAREKVVAGIERRAKTVVAPKSYSSVAKVPGIFRPIIDRIGFTDHTIARASASAYPDPFHVSGHRDA